MKSLAIISLLMVGAFCSVFQEQVMKDLYRQWKETHGKAYTAGHEDDYRFNTFTQNYLDILAFNARQDDTILALNQFADLTTEEFASLYTTTIPARDRTVNHRAFDSSAEPPASVDWRTKGAVTPVKNQGQCGSCWAFSATGALEGFYYNNNKHLLSFSEQQLVDCVTASDGCNGGLMSDAFEYTAQNGGIEIEDDYPYKAVDQKCAYVASKGYKVNKGYFDVTPGNVTEMKLTIAQQPVAVAVMASGLAFQFYAGGVIKTLCGDDLDHGVLAVGYGDINGNDAFIVKNSWGPKWGVNGYVYISTNPDANKGNGVCGILAMASYPH